MSGYLITNADVGYKKIKYIICVFYCAMSVDITDLAMLDAGYLSLENIDFLFSVDIEFVARLSEKNKDIYSQVLAKWLDGLKRPENLVHRCINNQVKLYY